MSRHQVGGSKLTQMLRIFGIISTVFAESDDARLSTPLFDNGPSTSKIAVIVRTNFIPPEE